MLYVSNLCLLVVCSNRVRPVGIASRLYPAGTDAVISGWGTTEDGVSSIMLRSAPVKLITNEECARGFRPLNVSGVVDASMICTTAERRGTCYVSIKVAIVLNFKKTIKQYLCKVSNCIIG